MSGRTIAMIGGGLVIVAILLMVVGAPLPQFLVYLAVLIAGAALSSFGLKRERAETLARLERERSQRG